MTERPWRILRAAAALLVRGPDAPVVLGDLEESARRERAAGMSAWRVNARYLGNALASALSVARGRLARRAGLDRPAGLGARFRRVPSLGISWLDVKLGLRMLVKSPLLTAVAVISLGIGIPVGLAPGQIIDALEAPLPVEDGDRIAILRHRSVETSDGVLPTSYDFAVWREALTSFETLAAVRLVEHNVDPGTGVAAPVVGAEVTPSAFGILGARPLLGRMLDAGDVAADAPPVVLLGEDLWRARMAGDSGAVGRTVRISGEPHTVAGIMPSGFGFPVRQEMWLPLRVSPAGEPGGGTRLQAFGRLADGATTATAETELSTVVRRLARDFPDTYGPLVAEVAPFTAAGWIGQPDGTLRASTEIWFMQMPSLLLLLVACVNVGLLVFARAATRSGELAVRTALGASRGRIVGQVLTEALLLALLSAGAGLLLLHLVTTRYLDTVVAALGAYPPYYLDLGVGSQTVVRALVLAAISAAAAAIVPALRVTGRGVRPGLTGAGAGGGGIRFGRLSTALVVADVAVAVAAVGVAVGVGQRIGRAFTPAEVPFAAQEYLAARIRLPASIGAFESDSAAAERGEGMAAIERELVDRLRDEPRVRGVAVASALPGMGYSRRFVEVDDGTYSIDRGWVVPGFFEGLGHRVVAGRAFEAADLEGDRAGVIVNEAFVENVLGGGGPLGRRLRYPTDGETAQWYEIVGVAPDLGMDPLNPRGGAGVYHPVAPGELRAPWLGIHLGPEALSFTPRLRELVAEVDPVAILVSPMTLDQAAPPDQRLMVAMVAGSAFLATLLLALAASGIYAIMSFTVARRTHEIGVRTALGARPVNVVATIGRRAAIQLAVGVLVGMPLAGQLYYLTQEDPAAKGAAVVAAVVPGVGVLLVLGLAACTVPLRRALRIHPTEALRAEG